MTLLQTKFYPIPVVIKNITASAHITYYAHITPHLILRYVKRVTLAINTSDMSFIKSKVT